MEDCDGIKNYLKFSAFTDLKWGRGIRSEAKYFVWLVVLNI